MHRSLVGSYPPPMYLRRDTQHFESNFNRAIIDQKRSVQIPQQRTSHCKTAPTALIIYLKPAQTLKSTCLARKRIRFSDAFDDIMPDVVVGCRSTQLTQQSPLCIDLVVSCDTSNFASRLISEPLCVCAWAQSGNSMSSQHT